MRILLPLVLLALCLSSCSTDEDEAYPSLITELVVAQADGQGQLASFVTDDGTSYTVENPLQGMAADGRLRALCSYAVSTPGRATVYAAQAVPVLWDWTGEDAAYHDPTGVLSVWMGGGYINLHLTPLTAGGSQAWGFARDSVTQNAAGTTTHHLSIQHSQLQDNPSYTTDLYACLSLDSIPALASADSLRLTVFTYAQPAVWQFAVQ